MDRNTLDFMGFASKAGLYSSVNENAMSNEERIKKAAASFASFLDYTYPNWRRDPSMSDTPTRVAKMYVNEIFGAVHSHPPKITSFENTGETAYQGIIFQGGIDVKSVCSHHIMPFIGKAYVAYIPSEKEGSKIIGLSKLNRIVEFCSRRPQVQESLTRQIHSLISSLIGDNKGVAVHIVANHMCVSMRGVNQESTMRTAHLSGLFFSNEIGTRDEFYRFVGDHVNSWR